MPPRPLSLLLLAVSLLLLACSTAPTTSTSDQHFTDARNNLKSSDFNAALKNLDATIKATADESTHQQAAVLHVAIVTSLADADKQMAEAYHQGAKEPAGVPNSVPLNKMRSDYYRSAQSRLMDAMQSVMDQRAKLGASPLHLEVAFPGFTGSAASAMTRIKSGQVVGDADRLSAETQADRNALARTLSSLAGGGQDPNKGQQLYARGIVEIDPRVYLIELSDSFLRSGEMFGPRALNEADKLRTVNEVVRGNLDVAEKLLAAKPDKDLEARAKKMRDDCDKALKKLGAA
jgi:hypothetical protein